MHQAIVFLFQGGNNRQGHLSLSKMNWQESMDKELNSLFSEGCKKSEYVLLQVDGNLLAWLPTG